MSTTTQPTVEPTPLLDASEEADIDCSLALSPHQRSCINLGKVEPCVNKAIQLLHKLRTQLEEQSLQAEACHDRIKQARGVTIATCMTDDKDRERGTPDHDVLSIEVPQISECFQNPGKEIGSWRSSCAVAEGEVKESDGKWRRVIEGALDLVIRMEKDRQDTLHKLREEKERVRHLNMKLDIESKRRLEILETTVQAEHEHSVNELKKLHQCVEKERKLLTGALCDVSIVETKDTQLRKEEADLLANVSLLQDKIADENFKIDEIAQLQQKTSDEVEGAQRILADAEDKLLVAKKKANAETKQRESKVNVFRNKVKRAREELKASNDEIEQLHSKICEAQATIKENNDKTKEYEESASKKKLELEDITSQVCSLQKQYDQLTMKKKEIKGHYRSLEVAWKKEREELERAHMEQQSAVAKAQHALQEVKDRREQMRQDNDRMREEIAACKKQQQDDKKALERGKKELVRLDQQLKVSTVQFTKLRDLNHMLSKRLEEEKARTGDEEYTLRGTIESLQKKITENQSARTDLEVKVKRGNTKLSELTKEVEEVKKKLERTTKQNTTEQQHLDKEIEELESEYKKRRDATEKLEQDIATIREQHDILTSTMGVKIEVLEKSAQDYKNIVAEKTKEYEALVTRTDLLQERTQELDKALASTDRMKKDIYADIERLEVTMEELKEELCRENEEEGRLKAELKDIVDFREKTKGRFLHYTEQRKQHLMDMKQRLRSSIAHNTSMTKEYSKLQARFLAIKSRMVEALQGHEDVEVATKDQKQLECVQAQLSSLMKTHLEYRSLKYTNKLLFCQTVAKSNYDSLLKLQTDLQDIMVGEEL